MATAADNIRYDVSCGVNEYEKKCVKLMYEVDDPEKRIKFEWIEQRNEDGSLGHVASMTALDSKRGHKSKPVPDDVFKKLGSPKKKRKDEFCQVKMSRPSGVSLNQYFGTASK